jgi:hypothetical protein
MAPLQYESSLKWSLKKAYRLKRPINSDSEKPPERPRLILETLARSSAALKTASGFALGIGIGLDRGIIAPGLGGVGGGDPIGDSDGDSDEIYAIASRLFNSLGVDAFLIASESRNDSRATDLALTSTVL